MTTRLDVQWKVTQSFSQEVEARTNMGGYIYIGRDNGPVLRLRISRWIVDNHNPVKIYFLVLAVTSDRSYRKVTDVTILKAYKSLKRLKLLRHATVSTNIRTSTFSTLRLEPHRAHHNSTRLDPSQVSTQVRIRQCSL